MEGQGSLHLCTADDVTNDCPRGTEVCVLCHRCQMLMHGHCEAGADSHIVTTPGRGCVFLSVIKCCRKMCREICLLAMAMLQSLLDIDNQLFSNPIDRIKI